MTFKFMGFIFHLLRAAGFMTSWIMGLSDCGRMVVLTVVAALFVAFFVVLIAGVRRLTR